MESIMWADATEQAALVTRGEVSPLELVNESIARIEKLDGALNSVIHRRFNAARREAVDKRLSGPFAGVPIVLKDWGCPSVGDPYHAGSVFMRNLAWRAEYDSPLTKTFRAAGFIIVGRTNTPELAMSMTTEPVAYGPTHNPWNLDRSAGGSSGGSAVAVAAGLVALGQASDVGGSIRVPASWCGVVGLKPSRGRVVQGPYFGGGWAGYLVDNVVTRTVRDTAAVLEVLSTDGGGNTYSGLPTAGRDAVGLRSGSANSKLRIGLLDHGLRGFGDIDVECAEIVRSTGHLLESMGHHVDHHFPHALEEQEFSEHFGNVVSAWCAFEVAELARLTSKSIPLGELEEGTGVIAEQGRVLPTSTYIQSINWLAGFQRRVAAWWAEDGYDLLVCPVVSAPAAPLRSLTDPASGRSRRTNLAQFVKQFNVTGQPAISLPLGSSSEGLPIGVQLIAQHDREDVLLAVAAEIERANPWNDRRPSMCV